MTRLLPTNTPSANTFMVGAETYRVGQELELAAPEQDRLVELKGMFDAIQGERRKLFQEIHAAKTDFDPGMHGWYLEFNRLFAEFQYGTTQLINAICDRLGAFIPIQFDYKSKDEPYAYIRPANQNDPLILTIPRISAAAGFSRQAAEVRALALALNDSYDLEKLVADVSFDYFDWIEMHAPFFTCRRLPDPLVSGDHGARTTCVAELLDRMLNEGGVFQSFQQARQSGYAFPMLALVVGREEARVVNLNEVASDVDGKTNQDRQFRVVEDHMAQMGAESIQCWLVVQAVPNLPRPEADQDGPKTPIPGFIVTLVTCQPDEVVKGVGYELGNKENRGTVTLRFNYPDAGIPIEASEFLGVYSRAKDRRPPPTPVATNVEDGVPPGAPEEEEPEETAAEAPEDG